MRSRGLGFGSIFLTGFALLACACSDDAGGDDEIGTDTGETGADTGETGTDTGDAGETGTDTGETAGTDTGGPLAIEVEVRRYPEQPMVVDLGFSAPELDITAEHLDDPGVHFGELPGDAERSWLRVRGLAPDTLHEVAWSVEDGQGGAAEGSTSFTTEAPLQGFVPSFPVEGAGSLDGYIVFDLLALGPNAPASLFVVDGQGRTRWHIGQTSAVIDPSIVYAGARLRPDGSLLYLRDYAIEILDELGQEQLSLDSERLGLGGLHHDVVELENGNFLTMSYTFRDVDYQGQGTLPVAGDLLVELSPAGEILWTWDSFDHLDPQRVLPGFEELIVNPDTQIESHDWTHGNGLVYEADTDTVLVSLRHQDWLIRVDRQSGELVWRFGDEGDFSLDAGTWPYHQHSPEWQEDGTLLLYDNGIHNPNLPPNQERSRAVRYAIDEGTMTVTQVWEDEAGPFLAPIAGDADRLDDGTLLITDSSIGMLDGLIHAQVRKVDEQAPAQSQWSFLTETGTFIYRCVASDRLPGEL